MRSLIISVLGALLALCAFPTAAECRRSPQTPPAHFIGLQLLHSDEQASWDIAADLQANWVKAETIWNITETAPGQFMWRSADASFEQIRRHKNMKVLLFINDAPVWLHDRKLLPFYFRRFLIEFVARYREDVAQLAAIEIFNEPNNPGYGWISLDREANQTSIPIEESGVLFAEVLKAANEVLRPAAPNTLIVSGGLFSHDNVAAYMKAMFSHDIRNCIDSFGYHPYANAHQLVEVQAFLQDYLKQLGAAGLPVWYTEFGTTDNDKRTELLQTVFAQAPKLNAQFWFLDRDFGLFKDTYGLVDYFGAPKPAYALFKEALSQQVH